MFLFLRMYSFNIFAKIFAVFFFNKILGIYRAHGFSIEDISEGSRYLSACLYLDLKNVDPLGPEILSIETTPGFTAAAEREAVFCMMMEILPPCYIVITAEFKVTL